MSARLDCAKLTLSIELEEDLARAGQLPERGLERVTESLLELLARYQMPGTWAAADPAASPASQRIAKADARHELALLGDASWVGPEAGRVRFGRELSRRTTQARDLGLDVATLVLRSSLPSDQCDLAIREGIVAVRPAAPPAGARRLQAQTLRFGLWGFPLSIVLPGPSRIWPGGGGKRAARQWIDRAVADRGLCQLAIDAPRLALAGGAAQRVLDRVLEHAQRHQRHGVLSVETLGEVARQLSEQQQSRPARSILRPAA